MDTLETLFMRALRLEEPWRIERVRFEQSKGEIEVEIDFPRGSEFECPKCGKAVKAYDTTQKRWRHLNFFQYVCVLVVRVPRIQCPEDGVRTIEVPWARVGGDFTYLCESFAMTLLREMPARKVAQIMKVDDMKLWRMMSHYVEAARQKDSHAGVTRLGIDETSRARGHDYVTIFVDLQARRTLYVAQGKGSEGVAEFVEDFQRHAGDVDAVTDVCIDMSPAFIKGVREHLPGADVSFDKYHLVKIVNDAVDEVRRQEVRHQGILRGEKYLFLKNRSNLTEAQQKRLADLESMPRLNLKTLRALHIRENFQHVYMEKTKSGFCTALQKWYYWATHSRISPVIKAAKTIKRHWNGVLSWFDSRIDNGFLESLNGLVQAARSKARGYRTVKNFKIMIYLLTSKLDFSKVGLPT